MADKKKVAQSMAVERMRDKARSGQLAAPKAMSGVERGNKAYWGSYGEAMAGKSFKTALDKYNKSFVRTGTGRQVSVTPDIAVSKRKEEANRTAGIYRAERAKRGKRGAVSAVDPFSKNTRYWAGGVDADNAAQNLKKK